MTTVVKVSPRPVVSMSVRRQEGGSVGVGKVATHVEVSSSTRTVQIVGGAIGPAGRPGSGSGTGNSYFPSGW